MDSIKPTPSRIAELTLALIRDRLPEGWQVKQQGTIEPDPKLVIRLETPKPPPIEFIAKVMQAVDKRDVAAIDRWFAASSEPKCHPILLARYLPKSVRDELAACKISYVDATGNMRITTDHPLIYIADRGADKDIWQKGRPAGGLKGEPSARLVLTLLNSHRRWRITELSNNAGVAQGTTYRVIEYLEREGLITKTDREYVVKNWEHLLQAWAHDLPPLHPVGFIDPIGADHFLDLLAESSDYPYAVTGMEAAAEWISGTPTGPIDVYVPSIDDAANRWGLQRVSGNSPIRLIAPDKLGGAAYLHRSKTGDLLWNANPYLVAASLLNGTDQQKSIASDLIRWIAKVRRAV